MLAAIATIQMAFYSAAAVLKVLVLEEAIVGWSCCLLSVSLLVLNDASQPCVADSEQIG